MTTIKEQFEQLCDDFNVQFGIKPTVDFVKGLLKEKYSYEDDDLDTAAAASTKGLPPARIQVERGKKIDHEFWHRIQNFVMEFLNQNNPTDQQKGKINRIVATMAIGKNLSPEDVKQKISSALYSKFGGKPKAKKKKFVKAASVPAIEVPALQIDAKINLQLIEEALGVSLPRKVINNIGRVEIEAEPNEIVLKIRKK
jgi:hypothetical protein